MIVSDIIQEIVEQLELPKIDAAGKTLTYALRVVGFAFPLHGPETLPQSRVNPGDRLELITPEMEYISTAVASAEPPAWRPEVEKNEISLELSVDGRVESVSLDSDLEIGDLITLLREKYELPMEDMFELRSMFRGFVIPQSKTLGSAGVPEGDRLFLTKVCIAGGAHPAARPPKKIMSERTSVSPSVLPHCRLRWSTS